MTDLLATVTVHRSLDAPSAAREFVADRLAAAGVEHLVPDATLLVSELVTNAVVHAESSEIRVDLTTADACVRCSVMDGDPGHVPVWQPFDTGIVGGLGLRIVDATADTWGVEVHDTTKSVWFELRVG